MKEKLTQCDVILKAMLENIGIKMWWKASDFQSGEYFVGYEATARMSDLLRMYPTLFFVEKDGRFRVIAIDPQNLEEIVFHKKRLNLLGE